MSLVKVGKYNNLSDATRQMLKDTRPDKGTVVTYRALQWTVDSKTGKKEFKAGLTIPPTSRFYDEETKQWVTIGLVNAANIDGTPSQGAVKKHYWEQQKNSGFLNITIGNDADLDELYDYLQLAGFVAKTKDQESSADMIMARVDHVQEAAAERIKRKEKKEAFMAATSVKAADLKRTALMLGINSNQEDEILRDQIEQQAENNPKSFMIKISDPDCELKSLCALAIQENVLMVNPATNSLNYVENGSNFMALHSFTPSDVNDQFAAFLKEQKDGGKAIVNMINSLVKSKQPK